MDLENLRMMDSILKNIDNFKGIKGIPASMGIAMGKAIVLKPELFFMVENSGKIFNPEEEKSKFKLAIESVKREYIESISKFNINSADLESILQAEMMILEDEYFVSLIENNISEEVSAAKSVFQEFEKSKNVLKQAEIQLFRDRIIELDNIEKKILQYLQPKQNNINFTDKAIVVAQSISPTDFLHYVDNNINAIITEVGGITSHLAILANSYKIPAIMGASNATKIIEDNDFLIVDAFDGHIFINPDENLIETYNQKIKKINEHILSLGKLIDLPSLTKDNVRIQLWCNANSKEDLNNALLNKAEGIGLVRTETYILKYNKFPEEDEQYEIYRDISNICYPIPVTFRAFDIGSDKFVDNLLKKEENPALGLRGIRYLLNRQDIFKGQIRSILRASANKNVRFMLPMITTLSEVIQSKQLINEVKQELRSKNIPYDEEIKIGVMIETPSAALISEKLANIVDFFSIGTNDLIQYVLAADRTNEFLSDYFNSIHYSILKLIKTTADAAKKSKIPVAICGELASHPSFTEILIGLGITELSVAPSLLLEIKEKIINSKYKKCKKLAEDILKNKNLNEFV